MNAPKQTRISHLTMEERYTLMSGASDVRLGLIARETSEYSDEIRIGFRVTSRTFGPTREEMVRL